MINSTDTTFDNSSKAAISVAWCFQLEFAIFSAQHLEASKNRTFCGTV